MDFIDAIGLLKKKESEEAFESLKKDESVKELNNGEHDENIHLSRLTFS